MNFLKKEFINFFSLYKLLKKKNIPTNDKTIDLMYIQNLYFSNQLKEAQETIQDIPAKQLTDELLLYKIKIDIKLKKINKAKENIDYFIDQFPESDLMLYVIYEKKILENKYDH